MEQVRMENALSRIEAALARLERVELAPLQTDPDLAQRHEAMRAKVGKALAELDALIADAEA